MSLILPRFNASMQRIQDAEKIGRILRETGAVDLPKPSFTKATAAGDTRRLRGIPCVARGVAGVSPGTHPTTALRS